MPHIRIDNQPVTQITVIEPEPGKQVEGLALMTERARFMARQPGFISVSVHRSLDGRRIVNYIQWQSRDLLQSAHKSPEFRKEWNHFDQLTFGLHQGIRIAGTGCSLWMNRNFNRSRPTFTTSGQSPMRLLALMVW